MRRPYRKIGAVRRSVVLLQEAAPRGSGRKCLRVKGGDVYIAEGGDVAVGVPRAWTTLVRQVANDKKEWAGVQLGDTATFTAHLPPVGSPASVQRAEEILNDILEKVEELRASATKRPRNGSSWGWTRT